MIDKLKKVASGKKMISPFSYTVSSRISNTIFQEDFIVLIQQINDDIELGTRCLVFKVTQQIQTRVKSIRNLIHQVLIRLLDVTVLTIFEADCLWKNKSGKGILQQIKRFCERQMFESVCLNEIVFMFISICGRQYVFWFVFGTIKMGLPNIHDMIYNSHCQLTQGIKIKTCLLLFKFRVNVVFVSTFSFIMHSDQLSSRCLYFYSQLKIW